MNLSILLTDFIDTKGMLKTYRFIPINQYNRIVVDRLSDICTDVKGNTDKDVGLLRVYNSDKCQLLSTTCKIKDFNKILFYIRRRKGNLQNLLLREDGKIFINIKRD